MNEPQDRIADLVRAAGRRPELPPEAYERMRAATHAQWQTQLRIRRRRQLLALAAGIAVAGLVALLLPFVRTTAPAASMRVAQAADGQILNVGDQVRAPATGGMALTRLPDTGTSLRLAANSRVRWKSVTEVELLAGAVYVDTGGLPGGDPLVILAGNARIEHVGTQFLTVRDNTDVTVAVRDGQVLVSLGDESRRIERGESAVLPTSGPGSILTGRTGSAAIWQWVDELAPSVAIEGRDLLSVLTALAYEGGLELRFANPGVETLARTTTLHGPALDLPPREAMRALLTSSGLRMTGNVGGPVVIDTP